MIRNRTLSLIAAALAAPLAVSAIAGASGPNLLVNGEFSAGTADWSTYQGFPAASVASENGTLVLTNESLLDTGTFGAAGQCVPGVVAGETYFLEVDAFDPAGQSRDGDAVLRIFWHASDDCGGAAIAAPIGPNSMSEGAWEQLVQESTAPDGANSARILLISSKDKAEGGQPLDGQHVIRFDNAYFGAAGQPAPDPADETPTEPPTQTPTETPTETPGEPEITPTVDPTEPGDETTPGDQEAGGADEPSPASQPGMTVTPGSAPSTQTIEAGGAPDAPSTGSGGSPQDGSSSTGTMGAGLAVALAVCATGGAFIFAAARRRRR